MEDKNNPDIIDASPLSKLVIQYKYETNSRKRDKLFLEICDHYDIKICNMIKNIKHCDKDEFIQIYRIEVLKAITNWKMQSNFETYLWQYLMGLKRIFMNSIKLFKKDLDYSLFADLNEYQEPTYELTDNFNEENYE